MRILIFIMLFTSTLINVGQSIDVESEKFKGIENLTIKSFNGCCSQKGYRAIYYIDREGNAIKSMNYFKRKHLASYVYKYDKNGLLVEKIQTYDINNKGRIDTTRIDYSFDSNNRMISKSEYFGKWSVDLEYKNFDANNNPLTVIRTFNNSTTITQRKFDSQNRIVHIQRFENDRIDFEEEIKYNEFNDIVYSYIPTLIDKETGKMVVLIGGNRHSVTESFDYKYDNQNRWIEKYAIFDNKKVT
ncbi:MAG TPA: hypothetical protein VK212_08095 [Lentimicrobium sp.]|nr:hypothetical protein [Lentimicrobium sp.]